jgi:hypothetical protein
VVAYRSQLVMSHTFWIHWKQLLTNYTIIQLT